MTRLLSLASLSISLVGCYAGERRDTGQCPAGEVCSDTTPRGLDFIGNRPVGSLLLGGPLPTAIGGTQAVALEYDRGDGVDVALDLPYTADDDGGLGVRVEGTSGSQVTVRGVATRTNYLRILDLDGTLMDRKELGGAALARMELVTPAFETVPADTPLAFAPGEREIGIALYGEIQGSNGPVMTRIIDTSMQLTLAGAERTAWDTLRVNAVAGTYALDVTAGDKPANTLDLVIVAQADSIAAIDTTPSTIAPNQGRTLCFQATNIGRYIAGLTWTFDVDGVTEIHGDNSLNRNCVSVSTTKTTGTVAVEASAGGQSMAVTLTVATAREQLGVSRPIRPMPAVIPTAGDRAAM